MAAIKVSKENFQQEVVESTLPVVVDFWADWCGPCKMLAPVLEQAEAQLAGEVKVCKINVDENPELAQQFSVMSIPTLVLMKGGKEAGRSVGLQPLKEVLAFARK